MSFLSKIFGPKSEPIKTNSDFWNWFEQHAAGFHTVLKQRDHIERKLLNKVIEKLNQLREGYFVLVGMNDGGTAELIITPDGAIKNIVFAEELIAAAPQIEGWKFIALKPAMPDSDFGIQMGPYTFNTQNLHFRYHKDESYPDNIAITIIHDDYNESNKKEIANGCFIFLDNYLGEYQSVSGLDEVRFGHKEDSSDELIPISKLKDFLTWREKEFVEKYDATKYDPANDSFGMLQADLQSGNKLIAVVNSGLLEWDNKASHPWIATVEVQYDGKKNNGMPDENTSAVLEEIQETIEKALPDTDGYLHIGRQTAQNNREIYLASREFRRLSKALDEVKHQYSDRIALDYSIVKDKYWLSMERFKP